MTKFNLVDQASIYGSYHNTIGNRIIHFICVPLIIWAVLLWFALIPLSVTIPLPEHILAWKPAAFTLNPALFLLVPWSIYMMVLEPVVGILFFALSAVAYGHTNIYASTESMEHCLIVGLVCQIIGWAVQIVVGHGYFEGRKPALFDSLFQVLVSPFFLVLELLFLLEYRPKLKKTIDTRVEQKIKAWKRSVKNSANAKLVKKDLAKSG